MTAEQEQELDPYHEYVHDQDMAEAMVETEQWHIVTAREMRQGSW